VALAGLALVLPLAGTASSAVPREASAPPSPGAAGIGDPYFPMDGNGGYDVRHYGLTVRYFPKTDRLVGSAAIRARARQSLSTFNLDLDGLRVRSVRVNGRRADWSRHRGELTVDPRGRGLARGSRFHVLIEYAGSPRSVEEPGAPALGFMHTDDGVLIMGQPHVAATWFPVNDHPVDRASYTFRVTVPEGLEVVANGRLDAQQRHAGTSTWVWQAPAPMASYLATVNVGEFRVDAYREDGIRYWDAFDPDLFAPVARPRTGRHFAVTDRGTNAYKRLTRTIRVPRAGAELSFWVKRDTEESFDFMFVEARPVGTDDWTTLRDRNGHTRRSTGLGCQGLVDAHPFLKHYQTVSNQGCEPRGTTGRWRAATGRSKGYEHWVMNLARYAGQRVEVSISYVTDFVFERYGVFLDDIAMSVGQGSTSFEPDGNELDGWQVRGEPAGSPGNPNEWEVGTVAVAPPGLGTVARRALTKQDQIIAFLSQRFGPYPYRVAGGIVDDRRLGVALETQTRPVYGSRFFTEQDEADLVVVHELAHQWFGNHVTVRRWKHIWLNEGFATYAEWLWQERQRGDSARRQFRNLLTIPARDPFWAVTIGDPGRRQMFDPAVYFRGAMTLHRLRERVGDADFFRILRRWHGSRGGKLATTTQFIRLSERISGEDLDRLFRVWLFAPRKPRSRTAQPVARSTDKALVARGYLVRPHRGG
jgi:hypothetical protein